MQKHHSYPLFLNLAGRLTVVIGGGSVGLRKTDALLQAGARVRVVCLEPALADRPTVEWRAEPYDADHLEGAVLVFAAATAEVNRQVVADARAMRIWVTSATEPLEGDFLVPAVLRRGHFVVAVGTGGAAPGLAREVCRSLSEQFDDAFGQWVDLLGEIRPTILDRIADAAHREFIFRRLCEWRWLDRLRSEGVEAVRIALEEEVRALAGTFGKSL